MTLLRGLDVNDRPRSHRRWLHELRNVVNMASVAATVGRELVADDPGTAADMLREAEAALAQCRDLLARSSEHVRHDRAPAAHRRRRRAA